MPEERLGRGAVPPMSLAENSLLTGHRDGMVRFGLIKESKVNEFAEQCVKDFDVRCGGIQAAAKSLTMSSTKIGVKAMMRGKAPAFEKPLA